MDPRQLAQTGLRAILSSTFGAYADKREIQAALFHKQFLARIEQPERLAGSQLITPIPGPDGDYTAAADGDFWMDFVADLGDGFDPTYTVARLLAERCLNVAGHQLHRGRILILGGDQVYPTATRDAYRDKFEGPYTAALPCVVDEEQAPCIFALPGNHDWYDGLTSFLRLFCHQRWIGGWRTQQRRSYFAVKLPHRWWLWGIDVQLEADVDLPQIQFFEKIAEDDPHFAGSKVILCTGAPSWTEEIHTRRRRERLERGNGYANLGFFERQVIVKNGAEPVLTLTGDLHHYCRYFTEDATSGNPRHKITAGGGGAYLLGTHAMPQKIELDDSLKDEDAPVSYARADALFPTRRKSFLLTLGVLRFPWKGWKLSLMLSCVYLLNAWIMQSASKKSPPGLLLALSGFPINWEGLQSTVGAYSKALAHSPGGITLWLIILSGFIAFAGKGARIIGTIHACAHLSANLLLVWFCAVLNWKILFQRFDIVSADQQPIENIARNLVETVAFAFEMLFAGTIVAGCIFGVYLLLCAVTPPRYLHINEAFSAQAIPHFKNFLRIKIDKSGTLTLFPIGIRRICRWKLRNKASEKLADHDPWFRSQKNCSLDSLIELIEEPIKCTVPGSIQAKGSNNDSG